MIQAGHADDAGHPGHRVPADAALLHPRHRHHRRREVTIAHAAAAARTPLARDDVPGRADVRRGASRPAPPSRRHGTGARRARCGARAGDVLRPGTLGRGISGARAVDRGTRPSDREPLLLPCPDAAARPRRDSAADVRAAERAIIATTGIDPRPWFRCPFGAGSDDPRVLAGDRRGSAIARRPGTSRASTGGRAPGHAGWRGR